MTKFINGNHIYLSNVFLLFVFLRYRLVTFVVFSTRHVRPYITGSGGELSSLISKQTTRQFSRLSSDLEIVINVGSRLRIFFFLILICCCCCCWFSLQYPRFLHIIHCA